MSQIRNEERAVVGSVAFAQVHSRTPKGTSFAEGKPPRDAVPGMLESTPMLKKQKATGFQGTSVDLSSKDFRKNNNKKQYI